MMTLISNIIKIRFLQIFREIRDVGMFRAIILMVVLVPLLALFLYRRLPLPGYNYGIPGVALLLIFMIHRARKDYFFLAKLFNPPSWVYVAEYVVFSVPFLVLLIVCRQYMQVLLYVALLLPVCFIVPSPKGAAKTYPAWIKHIPAGMFEWQSGIRANLVVMVPFYILGLAGVFSIWPVAASIILLSLTFSSFYAANESQKILAASELNAGNFLKHKLAQHVKCWALFVTPLFLIAFVHYEYWPYILAAFAAAINLVGFAILSKYAFYRPATTGGLSQLICSVAWLCSILLPLSAFVLAANIVLYFKAKHNLNYYLDAYH